MFKIKFSDGTTVSLSKAALRLRDSCFQPMVEDTDASEAYCECTDGHNRAVLHEYFGCGKIMAADVADRIRLLTDLDAWLIPVEAWPVDLRLSIKQRDMKFHKLQQSQYQMTWVPSAVAAIVENVGRADSLPIRFYIAVGDGAFVVADAPSLDSAADVSKMHKPAMEKLATDVSKRLHLPATYSSFSKTITVAPNRSITHPFEENPLDGIADVISALDKRLDHTSRKRCRSTQTGT